MFFKKKGNVDYLIVCLGNPGERYNNTRHNVGFAAGDFILNFYNIEKSKRKFSSLFYDFDIEGKKVILLKPNTFMNLTGNAVKEFCDYYKFNTQKIIAIHDDIDIGLGKVRIKRKGGHGGQNGVRNIIDMLDTKEFIRVKIGIGAKPHKDYDLAAWVLSTFKSEEKDILSKSFTDVNDAVKIIVCDGVDKAMNIFN